MNESRYEMLQFDCSRSARTLSSGESTLSKADNRMECGSLFISTEIGEIQERGKERLITVFVQ